MAESGWIAQCCFLARISVILSSPLGYFGVAIIYLFIIIFQEEDGPDFFLACGKGNLLPAFISDMFLKYWQNHNKLIEYLLIDYTFAIARANVPAIHQMIEEVPITVMGPLGKCLNQEYTEERWTEFCSNYP